MNLCTTLSQTCFATVVYSYRLMYNGVYMKLKLHLSQWKKISPIIIIVDMSFKQQKYNTNCLLKIIISSCHHSHIQQHEFLAYMGCMYY